MPDGVDWMGKNHPGACKPHNIFDSPPVFRRIAVDGALRTGRLVLPPRAIRQPVISVCQ